ncbi:release factor glutamine methyltransferase [Pedobacter sp. CG_S7]|uniref:peptide chain release factor N(5)-glutamine methyltransferase n=1 Tax=Pedobacter sp. CG_S7 TaxID=3143930 RepID=UPI003391A8DA
MNFKALKHFFVREIAGYFDPQEAEALFYMAVEKISGWGWSKVMLSNQVLLKLGEFQLYQDVIKQLQLGKPIQYIFNEAHFYGLTFSVSPAVLIPRAETEELVDWILQTILPTHQNGDLLDIGTGSGCIAISLKKHLKEWNVFALDISAEALAIATLNAEKNKVAVQFIAADVLEYNSHQKFELIVSNPPYIKENEKDAMHANVMEYEPHQALFVSNENPLIFYNTIADFAQQNLNKNGYLFFEINEYLGRQTVALLAAKGFIHIVLKKDMQGKDRMICCRVAG